MTAGIRPYKYMIEYEDGGRDGRQYARTIEDTRLEAVRMVRNSMGKRSVTIYQRRIQYGNPVYMGHEIVSFKNGAYISSFNGERYEISATGRLKAIRPATTGFGVPKPKKNGWPNVKV